MKSEQLSNLHVGWVVGGWILAVGTAAALYVGGEGLGVASPGVGAVVWASVSIATGFFVAGFLVGSRWMDAPILHGAAITLVSLVVSFVVALLGGLEDVDSLATVLGLFLLQLIASSAGGWMGRRLSVGPGHLE